jgi:hypothetical protein
VGWKLSRPTLALIMRIGSRILLWPTIIINQFSVVIDEPLHFPKLPTQNQILKKLAGTIKEQLKHCKEHLMNNEEVRIVTKLAQISPSWKVSPKYEQREYHRKNPWHHLYTLGLDFMQIYSTPWLAK